MSEHVMSGVREAPFFQSQDRQDVRHSSEYPCAISRADWGEILGSARTFGGIVEFHTFKSLHVLSQQLAGVA